MNQDAQKIFNEAVAHHQAGRLAEAEALYRQILALDASHADSLHMLGVMAQQNGRYEDAVALIGRAIRIRGDVFSYHNNLGNVFESRKKLDDAASCYERALALDSGFAEAHYNLGNVLREQGDFEGAKERYDRALALKPGFVEVHYSCRDMKTYRRGDAELRMIEDLAAGIDGMPTGKAAILHFTLGKVLEDIGDYDRAFEHLLKGNALHRRLIRYDELHIALQLQVTARVFDAGLLDRFRGAGDPSSVPVFILGMPRSGSTLVEQILSCHPQVHAGGELKALDLAGESVFGAATYPECVPAQHAAIFRRLGRDYLARLPALPDGKVRITDKLPGNFTHVGLIRLALPNARIIHTMRDPADTCLSCFSILFKDGLKYSYDLGELGRYYRRYSELMAHWRSVFPPGAMLDVRYEDVVNDLEGQARRLIDYCGLPWDDRCLDFHKNRRAVSTASAFQVRQPLFHSSLQRWRRYESHLSPLLCALEDDEAVTRGENPP
jgi:tetratricopeptide (TPR) repeat protein